MQPEEQIQKLHEALTLLNRGNATREEVTALFSTLSSAIKKIRENLEEDIKKTGKTTTKEVRDVLESIKVAERRMRELISDVDSGSKKRIDALKSDFNAKLEQIRNEIPEVPNFDSVVRELQRTIPKIPTRLELPEYIAGEGIDIQNREIRTTNPKITVSKTPPDNPQQNDLWIKVLR